MRSVSLAITICILLDFGMCWPTVINIPADYPAIQQGIDANFDGDIISIKCGTPVTIALQTYKAKFPDQPIDEILTRPSNLPDSFGSEHVLVHFTTIGQDAPDLEDIDPPDGIPDYINRVQETFEYVWLFETGDEQLGYLSYNTPPIDSGMGGDDRYDIYVSHLGYGYYGYAVPERIINQYRASSYIIIENDFLGSSYQNNPIVAVRFTAAHELFHAIQYGYDATEFDYGNINDPSTYKPWWLEASAVWMEEIVYDDINDYYNYLPFYFNYPWMSLGTFSYSYGPRALHPYGSCVWPLYLSEKYEVGIVREIWEECGVVGGYNTLIATDSALRNRTSSLMEAFSEFSIWNYHTGPCADTAVFYSEGDQYPNIESTLFIHALTTDTVFIDNLQNTPEHLASNYIVIQAGQDSGGVAIYFDGQHIDSAFWHLAVLGYNANGSEWLNVRVDSMTGVGYCEWRDWNLYDDIVIIPTLSGTTALYDQFQYQGFIVYDSTLHGTPTNINGENNQLEMPLNLGLSCFPNPFNAITTITFALPYESHTNLKIFDILGREVETLVDKNLLAGSHTLKWNAGEYNSGIYFARLVTNNATKKNKLLLLK